MDSGYHQGVELVVVLVCIAIGAGLAVGWCYLQVKFETFAKWTGGFDYTKDESKPAKSIKAGRPRIKDFVPPPPPPPEE